LLLQLEHRVDYQVFWDFVVDHICVAFYWRALELVLVKEKLFEEKLYLKISKQILNFFCVLTTFFFVIVVFIAGV